MKKPRKLQPLPPVARSTVWTAERVAGLPQLLDVRQLLANAERLGETALAALCNTELSNRRRAQLKLAQAQPALVGAKPRAKKKIAEDA